VSGQTSHVDYELQSSNKSLQNGTILLIECVQVESASSNLICNHQRGPDYETQKVLISETLWLLRAQARKLPTFKNSIWKEELSFGDRIGSPKGK